MADQVDRQAVKNIFTELYGMSAIGSVFDKYEWADICETTANELPSIQPTISILKNVEDAISRQDAIKYCYDLINAENPSDEHDYWNYSQERINQTEVILHHLEVMPSIQPETNCSEFPNNWIPCSDRLPEIDKEVLVTDGELCWVCSLFESPDIEDGLYQWEDNYGHWYEFETWVAWMPLPEYYREEG